MQVAANQPSDRDDRFIISSLSIYKYGLVEFICTDTQEVLVNFFSQNLVTFLNFIIFIFQQSASFESISRVSRMHFMFKLRRFLIWWHTAATIYLNGARQFIVFVVFSKENVLL